MQAVILAGGKGTRLRPYTMILPKPLMPVGDKAILEVIVRQLKKAGFDRVTITVGYLGELIETYFKNGEKFDLKIDYSREELPLGTVGPLSLIENLENDFLVMNGDVLCNVDFNYLYQKHIKEQNMITVCVFQKSVKIDLGVLEIDHESISRYIEKPTYNFNVSMGIYIVNKNVIEELKKGEYYDFPNLVTKYIEKREKVGIYRFNGVWFDIGRVEDYQSAVDEFEKNMELFL